MSSLPYRPCVGIALFNARGEVFVGRRIDSEETPSNRPWQMPQGGIDEGEDIAEAAFRELKEETGTDKAEIIRILDHTICYDLPPHLMGKGHEGRVIWGGKYRGQEQTWIAMRFTGDDSDIVLDADDHPEFAEWKWAALDELPDMIVPFKRDTYKQVIEAFKEFGRV